jgi:hypothetical protein
LSLPKPNTDFGKRCFKYNRAAVWNKLPCEVKVADFLSHFQRKELLIRQALKIGIQFLMYISSKILELTFCEPGEGGVFSNKLKMASARNLKPLIVF